MADNKKMVEEITSRDIDFARWYTDIVKKAELIEYAPIRGCMVLRPYGYEIWENMQSIMDGMIKATGHKNVYMPMLIPESLLQKEKDHVEGFAPEVAWITHYGEEKLTERLCVRPTSETLFCDHYKKVISSYRDLPKLCNQWCSVMRCEKTTRPFLRTAEFLWQEGHTAHATAEEAQEETIKMLNVYADFFENTLAIPVVKGQKTEKEKFAGAEATYTIESLMHDGKALQSGTSHNFGDGFAKAFDIQYTDKENKLRYVHQTSWGTTTRMMGAVIMVHGDDNGLMLPPKIAPIQAVVIPIAAHKPGVTEKADEIYNTLKAASIRAEIDTSDKNPGWKFSEYEMKGVPVRVEIGPRDLENNSAVIVRRDTREKLFVSIDELPEKIKETLEAIHQNMYNMALENLNERTNVAKGFEEFKSVLEEKGGFVKAMWCGNRECEDEIKAQTAATSRCMPFEQEEISDRCVCCGKPAKKLVYWAKAY